jgi:sulfite reductase (NADPH) flavoprotein alpha-component
MQSENQAQSQYNKDNPFLATLTENRLLNREGSAKETRHFVVNLADSGLTYSCGDSLGVYPTNDSPAVDELLRVTGLSGEEPVQLPKTDGTIPLREALTHRLSLAGPTKKTLQYLQAKVSNSGEKARLDHLVDPANVEEMKLYLENHEISDLLEEYPSVRLEAQELADLLKRLVPRLYSIASSPTLYPNEIHLTIAVVRYSTNGRLRKGVASTYLADRCDLNSSTIPVFVASSHFAPPEDPAIDMIMVGPGTGIAPFRSFLQEQVARQGSGRTWIFFGDQHRATDYLYEEEFTQYLNEGKLTRLDLAFSRDQAQKIYVQDRMRENSAEIWAWLNKGAIFYVCGDAKRMAVDVEKALTDIISSEGGMAPEEATHYLKQLRKEKRYQKDVY